MHDQLAKGRSVEITQSSKISYKDASYLNSLYWDAVEAIPFRDVVAKYPDNGASYIREEEDIKLWLGRQHGDVVFRTTKEGRDKAITSKFKAIEHIKQLFFLDDELASKYLNLNQQGFFDEERTEGIKAHWQKRVGLDLGQFREMIKSRPGNVVEVEEIDHEVEHRKSLKDYKNKPWITE